MTLAIVGVGVSGVLGRVMARVFIVIKDVSLVVGVFFLVPELVRVPSGKLLALPQNPKFVVLTRVPVVRRLKSFALISFRRFDLQVRVIMSQTFVNI